MSDDTLVHKEPEWTGGPWIIDDQPGQYTRIGVIGDRDVDRGYGERAEAYLIHIADVIDIEGFEANAELISAAPDLYDALVEIVSLRLGASTKDGVTRRAIAALCKANPDYVNPITGTKGPLP